MFPTLAAATGAAEALLALFAVLLAAKADDELFKRIGQPALIGEILAGWPSAPSVLGLVERPKWAFVSNGAILYVWH